MKTGSPNAGTARSLDSPSRSAPSRLHAPRKQPLASRANRLWTILVTQGRKRKFKLPFFK